jgi:acetylornithine deacetylase/succinyl-diaminopimelate desuccinylase-like protein
MRNNVIDLVSSLVAIDSVNPSLVEGGAGESAVAAFIVGWAAQVGLESEVLEDTPGRPTVLVRARGTNGGKTLLLCGHVDTVNVEDMPDAHRPRVDGDRLYGRGAYDMKAGVAAALLACREAAALNLAGDVVVAAVADEEHSSIGIQEALRTVTPDAAIVTEPTELAVAVAHKGFAWVEIEVSGVAAHGSRPHLGVDAIVKAGPILTGVGQLDADLAAREHPLLGRGSVHGSTINGGIEMSSYAARCAIGLERRTLPGETAEQVRAEIDALLDRCRAADPDLVVEHRPGLVREPFEVPTDSDIVKQVTEAAAEVFGRQPEVGGVSYWADAAFIASAGVPTVLLGPGGHGAHGIDEWVSIGDTEAVTQALVGAAIRICP